MAIKYQEPCMVFSPDDGGFCSICSWPEADHKHNCVMVDGVCSQCSGDPAFAAQVKKGEEAIEAAVAAIADICPQLDAESHEEWYARCVYVVRTSCETVHRYMTS